MIQSAGGVISTTDESVMHYPYVDSRGDLVNCTTPYHLHFRENGDWLRCADAAKFARMGGVRTLKSLAPKEPEERTADGKVNLPRPLNLAN